MAVIAGQVIDFAQIGNLVFAPAPNANGDDYATLTFQVTDDGGTANGGQATDQSPNTITFDVTPVNDAPEGADNTVTLLEDGSYAFQESDFGFTDPVDEPGNNFRNLKIGSLPDAGVLTLNGIPVRVNQIIGSAQIPNLVFTPAADANGVAYASFNFQVQDDGGRANNGIDTDLSLVRRNPNTITFNVTPVDDPVDDGSGGTSSEEIIDQEVEIITTESQVDPQINEEEDVATESENTETEITLSNRTRAEEVDELEVAGRGIDGGGDGTVPNQLVQARAQQIQNEVMEWAELGGLTNEIEPAETADDINEPDETTTGSEPLAFVDEAQKETGLGLLETLILGGGSLYAIDRITGNRFESIIRRLLNRKAIKNSEQRKDWLIVGVGRYERVLTIFKRKSESGLLEIAAGRITNDKIDIIATQLLPMSLEAAALPNRANIEKEIQELIQKTKNQVSRKFDITYIDPSLQDVKNHAKELTNKVVELEPKPMQKTIENLNEAEKQNLQEWIKKPKQINVEEENMNSLLKQRHDQLTKSLNSDKGLLVTMLELSLAMINQ